MSDHTHTFARFWKCALQVNTAGYSAAFRGKDVKAHRGSSCSRASASTTTI